MRAARPRIVKKAATRTRTEKRTEPAFHAEEVTKRRVSAHFRVSEGSEASRAGCGIRPGHQVVCARVRPRGDPPYYVTVAVSRLLSIKGRGLVRRPEVGRISAVSACLLLLFASGVLGLSGFFSDPGPGEKGLQRLAFVVGVYAVGCGSIGLLIPRLRYLSVLGGWGPVIIADSRDKRLQAKMLVKSIESRERMSLRTMEELINFVGVDLGVTPPEPAGPGRRRNK